ncbi:MAG: hypothetical protein E7456_03545 [Ruminococcaceae bacterium]|nr:hypothetical protein [Oscillospiraceae bacterium]
MLSKTIIKNTILLTMASLFMRVVGLIFQVWVSKRIGADGLGLFQLIGSVSMFAATVAISGIRFATTRLVSEELGAHHYQGAIKALKRCMMYAGFFGTLVLVCLYFGAGFIGRTIIGRSETVASLRILALCLPFMSLSSVLSGYFTAVGRVIKTAVVSIAEQLVRISIIVILLDMVAPNDIEHACAAIVTGNVAGECVSFLLHYVLYLHDKKTHLSGTGEGKCLTKRMFGIAAPLAVSAYTRTALTTAQNLLIPRGFEKSGASSEKALADYGTIDGMVFPIITFPSALFYALADTLLPELTSAQVAGRQSHITKLVSDLLSKCLIFSIGVTSVLFFFSDELGQIIYSSLDVGHYIRIMSLLMPFMYMDSVTDGMLRGLGQHMYVMKYNISDALMSLVLVIFLLPKYAVFGYIFILYFSELFNFFFSIRRLKKVSHFHIPISAFLRPIIAALGSVILTSLFAPPVHTSAITLVLHIIMSLSAYCMVLFLLPTGGKSKTGVKRRLQTVKQTSL